MEMRQTDAMPDAVFVDASRSGSTLSPGAIAVPASLLAGLGAPFNTLDMDGDVRLAWTEWRVLGRSTFGQVIVTLDDMASRVSRVKPLGSYRVVFQAEGEAGTIDLATSRGPLLLSGKGRCRRHRRVQRHGDVGAGGTRKSGGTVEPAGKAYGPDTVELTFARMH